VLDPDKPSEFVEVFGDGRRLPAKLEHDEVLDFAKSAANAFGVGANQTAEFDRELAKRDVQGDKTSGEKAAKKGKKKG